MQLTMDRAALVGQSLERIEDAALLSGRGAYMDDLGIKPGTLHAAILRSPHAHADIVSIRTEPARALPGVFAVMSGPDLAAITAPLISGVRAPIEARAIAVERVRYVGEPVAIALASDRYRAEDAIDAIEVEYRQHPVVVDPQNALDAEAPILHEAVGSNLVSDRTFVYGDPDAAFAAAARCVSVTAHYPRNTGSPIETYGVVAHYDPHGDAYEILANFQGPFSLHAVIARALKVPGKPAAPAHAAGLGWQLRRQAGNCAICGSCCGGGTHGWTACQMGRGSPGASCRLGVSDEPRQHLESGCRRGRTY